MKVIYHLDLDGKCAARQIYNMWKATGYTPNKDDFIMMNYGWDTSWIDNLENSEKVYIVDFSLEPEDMERLWKRSHNIIWCDHHISAIKKYEGTKFMELCGIRDDLNVFAGCMVTWRYLFNKLVDDAPLYVKLISDHDTWTYDYGDMTKHFILGLGVLGNDDPWNDEFWDKLNDSEEVKKITEIGKYIELYRDNVVKTRRKTTQFEFEMCGKKMLCFNNTLGNSTYFGDDINNYELVCLFHYDGQRKIWSYSFYSVQPDVNCAEIAEQWKLTDPDCISGGGHKGAAGMQHKKFIFE